jgi:hypothetical protein
LGPALALALSTMATPATADVTVFVDFDKWVDITVVETITKTKIVNVDVTADLAVDGAAEAEAVVNVINDNNRVGGAPGITTNPDVDFEIFLKALIDFSINGNSGIVGVNSDVGNMVNQGNVVSLSVTGREPQAGEEGIPAESSLTHSQAEADQSNTNNRVFDSEFLPVDVDGTPLFTSPNKLAGIKDSINGNSGIVGVNQNAGNMNNQHNLVALSIGFQSFVALSEAALGQENVGNVVFEIETIKRDGILRSVNGNSGVVSINQSVGNMNNQAHVVSFSALTSNIAVGIPGS